MIQVCMHYSHTHWVMMSYSSLSMDSLPCICSLNHHQRLDRQGDTLMMIVMTS